MPQQEQKTLTITFCGAPNVGKSTLLNRLLNHRLSICSPKPQTTRFNIKGIITNNKTQLIIIDTPGIFRPKVSQMEKQIVKEAWQGLCGAELICVILDAQKGVDASTRTILQKIKNNNIPMIAVINKSDLLTIDDKILLAKQLAETENFADIFSLSAKTGRGCEDLLEYFRAHAKPGHWNFTADELTDKNSEFLASEFVREQLFLILSKELPYMLSCETEMFEENDEYVKISVIVKIGKKNHKKMILGKNGINLRKIIRKASVNLENLFNKHVKLSIFIKSEKKE